MTMFVLGCLWVLAATIVACLPMKYQFAPGLLLFVAAPWLIWQIGAAYGWVPLALAAAAFVSMFRRPLVYYVRRVFGRAPVVSAAPGEEPR